MLLEFDWRNIPATLTYHCGIPIRLINIHTYPHAVRAAIPLPRSPRSNLTSAASRKWTLQAHSPALQGVTLLNVRTTNTN